MRKLEIKTLDGETIPTTSTLPISWRRSMMNSGGVDRELSALINDVIEAGLLPAQSPEIDVARRVAEKGQSVLDTSERRLWETRVLPVLSKPLDEQIAIATILRRGGYVPRKIEF